MGRKLIVWLVAPSLFLILLSIGCTGGGGDVNVATTQPVTLSSIAITPANPSIAIGATQQFTAVGTYSNGTVKNITNSVTWSSVDTKNATITPNDGLATGVASGTTTILATLGLMGTTTLMIKSIDPILQSIAVTPANPSISTGATLQFTATGSYSDGTLKDITGSVTWSSSDTSKATISTTGMATGVAAGTSSVMATLGITGTKMLTITPITPTSTLQSIAVTPANPSILTGATLQFTATGSYSDGTMKNITSSVTWSSSDTSKATIVSTGMASGVAALAGTSTIIATSGSIVGMTTLAVETFEGNVRGIMLDITLAGTYPYYYSHINEPTPAEAIRRWDNGIRVTNAALFERILINGAWLHVYKGTNTPINQMDIKLTTD